MSVLVDNARRAAIASAGQRARGQTQLNCSLMGVVWEEEWYGWYEWYVTDEKINRQRLKGSSLTGISV